MTTRRALLIESSATPGQTPLPGAMADVNSWRRYLTSLAGGAWKDEEITTLSNPTKAQVLAAVGAMNADYGFVTFSGHGCVRDKQTMVLMKDGEVGENALTGSKVAKVTLVLDTCRHVEEFVSFAAMDEARVLKEAHDLKWYLAREQFDAAVRNAEKGVCSLYGSDFDESAHDDLDGGLFTRALISAGAGWGGTEVMSLPQAFALAKVAVQAWQPRQTPQAAFHRRIRHFPFATAVR